MESKPASQAILFKAIALLGWVALAAFWGGLIQVCGAEPKPQQFAIELIAQVNTAPPSIDLYWPPSPVAFTLQRKDPGAITWNTILIRSGLIPGFLDTNVQKGVIYEYAVTRTQDKSSGYLIAAIDAPLVEQRGTALLMVDASMAPSLSSELKLLTQDLIGDGWAVRRRDIARDALVIDVKAMIKAEVARDPKIEAVFLLGHIPVPYSGDVTWDGHSDHSGAWPADAFYGDLDGVWTDTSVNNT